MGKQVKFVESEKQLGPCRLYPRLDGMRGKRRSASAVILSVCYIHSAVHFVKSTMPFVDQAQPKGRYLVRDSDQRALRKTLIFLSVVDYRIVRSTVQVSGVKRISGLCGWAQEIFIDPSEHVVLRGQIQYSYSVL